MRVAMIGVVAALCAVGASAATAEKGMYSGALRKMLTQTAAGTCPSDVMADSLLKACREQLPRMAPAMKALGNIKAVTFVKAVQSSGRRIETYKVAFAGGKTATWMIGGLQGGKYSTTYSEDTDI